MDTVNLISFIIVLAILFIKLFTPSYTLVGVAPIKQTIYIMLYVGLVYIFSPIKNGVFIVSLIAICYLVIEKIIEYCQELKSAKESLIVEKLENYVFAKTNYEDCREELNSFSKLFDLMEENKIEEKKYKITNQIYLFCYNLMEQLPKSKRKLDEKFLETLIDNNLPKLEQCLQNI